MPMTDNSYETEVPSLGLRGGGYFISYMNNPHHRPIARLCLIPGPQGMEREPCIPGKECRPQAVEETGRKGISS